MGRLRVAFRYLALLLACGGAGLLLLVLAYALPTQQIEKHVAASLPQIEQEGTNFSAFGSHYGTKQDNYTEAIYLSQAAIGGGQGGILHSALVLPKAGYGTGEDPVDGLAAQFSEQGAAGVGDTKRFFGGWLVPLKVFLQLMTYGQLRYFNFIAQCCLLFFVCRGLARRKLHRYVAPFLLAVLFLNPVTIALTLSFSGFYYEILLALLVMLHFHETLQKKGWYGRFFFLLGITAFYFNMNYYQLCTLGFPLVLYFLLVRAASVRQMLSVVLRYGALWFAGFAGMMLLKWGIYAAAVDSGIFQEMWRTAAARMDMGAAEKEVPRLEAVYRNFREGIKNIAFVLVELAFLVHTWRGARGKLGVCFWERRTEIAFVLLALLAVALRYFLEAEHSYVHCWVMYRNLGIFVFALNVLAVKRTECVPADAGLESGRGAVRLEE